MAMTGLWTAREAGMKGPRTLPAGGAVSVDRPRRRREPAPSGRSDGSAAIARCG